MRGKVFCVWRTFINRYTILLLEPSNVVCCKNMVNQLSITHILQYFILRRSTIMKTDTYNFSIMIYLCNLQKLYIIKNVLLYICTFYNNNFGISSNNNRIRFPSYLSARNWIPLMFQVETCHSCFHLSKTLLLNFND